MSQLLRPAFGRSVHLKVHPRPQTIAECRQVLQALRVYGDVETFKNLKYEANSPAPNSFLAVFKDKQSAEDAASACLIDITYADQSHEPMRQSTIKPDDNEDSADSISQEPEREHQRTATITIDMSRMDHEAYIARQPYCSQYGRTVSALHDDLHRRLPEGMGGMAYVDYNKKEVPWRIRAKRAEARGTKSPKSMRESTERNSQAELPRRDAKSN